MSRRVQSPKSQVPSRGSLATRSSVPTLGSGLGTRDPALDTLPPAHCIHCSFCGKRFALRARLKEGLLIRCSDCGKMFRSKLDAPGGARSAPERPREACLERRREGRRLPRRRIVVQEDPRRKLKRRMIAAALLVATAGLLALLYPLALSTLPARQWDVSVSLEGGKKATFSLYGSAADRIERVDSSFDEGPLAADSSWNSYRDEARMLPEGSSSTAVGFTRGDISWSIHFSGQGTARVERAGKLLTGTVIRAE